MSLPASTYRLQLTPGFTLHDAARVVPYTRSLGISHLYLSPVLEARAGSAHGYDVTDPGRIRRELGGEDGFAAVVQATRAAGMRILLDIVPNHMAASAENPAWRDLLEFGADSPHARTFDLSWRSDPDRRRLLLPVLGDELVTVIAEGQIRIECDARGLLVRYGEQAFPLSPCTYRDILRAAGYAGGLDAFADLARAAGVDEEPQPERRARAMSARDTWLQDHGQGSALAQALEAWNGQDTAGRRELLREVLDRQIYELGFWRRGSREVGYRRFFDVTDLAGVRVEDPAVYEATHARVLEMVRAGEIEGFRIDHVDGLRDPGAYLERLAQSHTPAPLLLVEKILAPDESLPGEWPVAGTTGYEFANAVGGWFLHPDGWRAARAAYTRFTGTRQSFEDLAYARQRRIIDTLFGGELRVLVCRLLALANRAAIGGWTADDLSQTLAEVSACLDVYRTYVHAAPVVAADRLRIERACDRAARRAPSIAPELIAWLRNVLLLEVDDGIRGEALDFVMCWQQFTGPVMAKGFEDTALYNDFTLTSANEVGGNPGAPVMEADRLHDFFADRAARSPGALNATSTHDTKRSEDVRQRIAALTLFPAEWTRFLDARAAEAGPAGPAVPSPADRVLLFQTLLGTWPDGGPDEAYAERITAYMTKATREAKSRTSWHDPDPGYEAALADAVRSALDPAGAACAELAALARKLAHPAMLASLAQTLIKVTAPGVPDFYQGAEGWHYALVDPDNRSPVDYEAAGALWASVCTRVSLPDADFVRALLEDPGDGRIKLFVTTAALQHRLREPDLFASGDYIPLAVQGGEDRIFAFARVSARASAITIVGRPSAAGGELDVPFGVTIRPPAHAAATWRDVLTGARFDIGSDGIRPAEVLSLLPCALLAPA